MKGGEKKEKDRERGWCGAEMCGEGWAARGQQGPGPVAAGRWGRETRVRCVQPGYLVHAGKVGVGKAGRVVFLVKVLDKAAIGTGQQALLVPLAAEKREAGDRSEQVSGEQSGCCVTRTWEGWRQHGPHGGRSPDVAVLAVRRNAKERPVDEDAWGGRGGSEF